MTARRRPAVLPDPPPPAPYGVGFDWSHHKVAWSRPEGRCQHCGRSALMTNESGDPEHKVCAEGAAVAQRGEAAVRTELALYYASRKGKGRDGSR